MTNAMLTYPSILLFKLYIQLLAVTNTLKVNTLKIDSSFLLFLFLYFCNFITLPHCLKNKIISSAREVMFLILLVGLSFFLSFRWIT